MSAQMEGKVCVVTGASIGIGKSTALALAKMGARVALVCRDEARGKAVQAEIKAKAGHERVDLFLADLSLIASVRRLSAQLLEAYPKIHVLVNNAGVIMHRHERTADGLEKTFATNHIGYFLLTTLLLDRLKESAPARVVSVSSGAHASGKIDFDDLQSERNFRWFQVYGTSKLQNILFTRELAERLRGSGVTANCMHPGGVGTNFGQNTGLFKYVMRLARPFLLTPEQGADTLIYLASAPEVAGISGEYFYKRKVTKTSRAASDTATAKKLWQVSEQLCAAR